MPKLILMAVLFLSYTPLTLAQGSGEYSKVEVFAGFSHNRVDTGIDVADTDFGPINISDGRTGFNGFNVAATRNISKYIGLKFDFSAHFNRGNTGSVCVDSFPRPGICADFSSRSALYNFLGGVQIKNNSREGRFKPFAHALVGAAHDRVNFSGAACHPFPERDLCGSFFDDLDRSDTGLAGAFGGGLDIRAGDRVDVRVFQVDYNPARLFDLTRHNFRIGFGIVIR